jgi:two-component system response regulator AtoC
MATFAALESPSLLDLPRKEVIFCRSSTLSTIQRSVEKAVNAKMPLLLQGASGHDKEIPARFIHSQSRWVNRAFVRVSCPSIPGTLFESELFGFGKGAFTKTHGTKAMWLRALCGHVDESIGTLGWLDRIS